MIRSELVAALGAQHPELRTSDVAAAVAAFFDEIGKRLAAGGRVELRGFGTFSTRPRRSSAGRNPRTGEIVEVIAKRAVHYRQSKMMKARLNPRLQVHRH